MGSPKMTMTTQPSSAHSSSDENPRAKFLCSFSGSILPRPQDGKLRYVGGVTRIVRVRRDIAYEELMGKMRELFEGPTVLKYQQPDEDLDALVSVVNDDDVTNMMEEYDKLGSCDGFTRLRIFLFSHSEQDGSVHFSDRDERDSERQYFDALNSLNESPESRKQLLSDFQVTGAGDDIHSATQYFNQMSIEGSLHKQRNFDVSIPQINLHHLTIPQMGSAQHQQSIMDASWSPMCYSPKQPGHLDSSPITEFPTSPTSAVYQTPYGDFTDKYSDRMPEEYNRHPVSHQSSYDLQSRSDNLVYVPSGPVSSDKSRFTGNITHGSGVFEGNNICENCKVAFQRNQAYPDSTWKYVEPAQLEVPSIIGNGFHPVPSPCGKCLPNREMVMLNADTKSSLPLYHRELNDPRLVCNETQTHGRGWILQPHLNSLGEEPRSHITGVGRLNDHYITNSNGMNIATVNGNLSDGHYLSQHYVHHEDPRLLRPGSDMANEVFHDQAFATGSHIHIPLEDRGVRYGNFPYGVDNHHQMSHGYVPPHTLWRNVHNPVHGAPFELSSLPQQIHGMVGPGLMRSCTLEGSPMYPVAVESQSPLVDSSKKMVGTDEPNVLEYSHSHSLKFNPNTCNLEHQYPCTQECIRSQYDILNITASSCLLPLTDSRKSLIGEKLVSPITSALEPINDNQVNGSIRMEKDIIHGEKEINKVEDAISGPELSKNSEKVASLEKINSTYLGPSMDSHGVMKGEQNDVHVACQDKRPANVQLSFLPGLIESVKKAAIKDVQEVKASVQENLESSVINETQIEEIQHEPEATEAQGEVELDSDNDNSSNAKIEPTQAEAEAIAKGLQTIKNDDLEEIRELGSGTYGAVYHGKWRGSDVAIKRIKASCFAGKPSERDRLIADFWKEALILSSLHHPNVVSFYGIVRDGLDGSLATVTEFMVNGSLKQFLRKKDRTIDRRKRLIIAMDAAFGMEYLHGKNIVHFDLKCENLLVNMRDPHRPVCKIGDLGLSKVKQHTLVSGGVRGTLPWMAPELLSGKSNMVTEKIDVYSFGVVMWELLTGDEPYADMHCASIIGGIVNNSLRPETPSWCDPEWKALMESCWASDPAQRPSFSEISQRLRNMATAINVK